MQGVFQRTLTLAGGCKDEKYRKEDEAKANVLGEQSRLVDRYVIAA